ncbi:MAG TPA: hypothetical protein VGF82_04630 [Terracidiphilus sp.]
MTYSILFSSHRLLKVLYVIAILAIAYALVPSLRGHSWLRAVERLLRKIAHNRWRAIVVAAAFPLVVRVCMLPWYPPPPPQIHDEFSYLLQGDTFAHGRVSNPTPPYWEHFETEYTLLRPTYASQYEPAQGLVLAFGEVVFGHPWWGVWLSLGIMCGTFCWALAEILPTGWAFAGAIGAGLQFGIFGLWMNSYFGGAVAAIAGAVIVGSLARLRKRRSEASSSALCAAGIIVTFASRPFEALLWICIAVAFVCYYALRAKLWGPRRFAQNVLLPFALVFLCGAGLLAWYNWRITGSPADPPYLAYQRIYGTPQPFWWQPPVVATEFRYPELRDNYLNQVNLYDARYSFAQMLGAERTRLTNFWRFFIGPFFTPALLFLPWIWRDKRIRPWLLISIPFILDKASYHAWYPAHSAPETILIVLVLIESWRHMRAVFRRRGIGVAASRTLIAAVCLTIVLGNAGRAAEPLLLRHGFVHLPAIWESFYPAKRLRDDVSQVLEGIPGKHLLFVKYAPGHCFCEEWVFNLAELSEQRIVYAREYTPESDRALAESFTDRDVWLIEPDERPYHLVRLQSDTEWSSDKP